MVFFIIRVIIECIIASFVTHKIIVFFSKFHTTEGRPGWLNFVSIIGLFFLSFLSTFLAYESAEIDFTFCILSGIFILLLLYFIIYHFIVRIEIKNNTFYFVDIFFRKHSFSINSDTLSYKKNSNVITIYNEGKKYYIVNNIYGAHEILENLPKRKL